MSQQTAAALGNLLTLFGTFTLVQDVGDYLEDGFLSGSQAAALRTMQYMVGLPLGPVPALPRVMAQGGAACLQLLMHACLLPMLSRHQSAVSWGVDAGTGCMHLRLIPASANPSIQSSCRHAGLQSKGHQRQSAQCKCFRSTGPEHTHAMCRL